MEDDLFNVFNDKVQNNALHPSLNALSFAAIFAANSGPDQVGG